MASSTEADLMDLIPPEAEIVRRIVQEVRQYPRIRQPLLRFLTADDFDELIAMSRENADGIKQILERMGVVEERMGVMDERMGVMEERMGVMDERMGVMEGRLASVEESVAHIPVMEERLASVEESVAHIPVMEGNLRSLNESVNSLRGEFGRFRGDSYEAKCREQVDAVLDGYFDHAVLVDREHINVLLRTARTAGRISRRDLIDGYNVDIIARDLSDPDGNERLAAAEASITFNREDLETARRRAELIGRVTGIPTGAYLVTHHEWPADVEIVANQLGVTIIQFALPKYASGG